MAECNTRKCSKVQHDFFYVNMGSKSVNKATWRRGREGGFEDEFYNSQLVEKGDSNQVNCLTKQQ